MGRKKKTPPRRRTAAVIVEGETEKWYISMLKRNERDLPIYIKPELNIKKTLEKQYEYVINAAEDYTMVFWVVDFDTILAETRTAKKGTSTPLEKFNNYRRKIAKKYKNVAIIVNNPCLEFWLLLHFEPTSRYFDKCDKAIKQLKKHLPNYEKTEQFYTKQDQDIYLKLKPQLQNSIKNAEKLGEFDPQIPYKAIAEMHLFFLDDVFEDYFKED